MRTGEGDQPLVGTGVAGLDQLLCGGVLRGATVLVEGAPGAGKTTLALSFLREGALRHNEPGIMITFEELPHDLHRDASSFGWDLHDLEERGLLRILCTTPEALTEDTLSPDGIFERTVAEIRPTRVVIDSINQMAHVSPEPLDLRREVYSLTHCYRRHDLTAILTGEVDGLGVGPFFFAEYLADVVIRLDHRLLPDVGERIREIEVTKTRARPHLGGRHPFDITADGLVVVPRLETVAESPAPVSLEPELISTGSVGLDEMLGGGLVRGSTTIVAGSTGVGKTVLGLQFLLGATPGVERGLFVSFEQSPSELARMARSLGLPEDRLLGDGDHEIVHRLPRSGRLAQLTAEIAAIVRERKPDRVVVDAISTLAKTAGEPGRVVADVGALVSALHHSGATTIICDETPGLVGEFEVTGGVKVSSIADTIIILRYVELGSEMRRAVSVLKARYSDHDKEIREYVIGQGGLELRDKFQVSTGLLRGAPVHRAIEDFF